MGFLGIWWFDVATLYILLFAVIFGFVCYFGFWILAATCRVYCVLLVYLDYLLFALYLGLVDCFRVWVFIMVCGGCLVG